MSSLVIIDGNNTAYKAYYAYARLTYKGKPVSILYGFISMVRMVISRFTPNKVIVCWDSTRSPHRTKVLPTYKAGRKDKVNARFDPDDFNRQLSILQKVLHILNVFQVKGQGIEADDWIFKLYMRYRKRYKRIIIISSDKDFHQMLTDDRVTIWESSKKLLLHKKTLHKHFPYKPDEVVDYLSLDGDKSDSIPGYRGMGEKKIRVFLDEFGSISSFLNNKNFEFPSIDKEKLLEVYKTNRILIDLRVFYKKFMKKQKITFLKENPTFKHKSFLQFCSKYNFVSFSNQLFTRPFKTLNNED